jgi:hypothetical protein
VPVNSSTVAFDPFSAEFFNDPYPIYRRLPDDAPVLSRKVIGLITIR